MPRRCAEGPQQGWQPDPHSPSVVNYINQGLDNPEYGGAHRPPDNEAGNTLDNLTDIYPSDIYSPAGARLYGHGGLDTAADQRVVSLIRAMKGKPNAKVTIYRAIPSNAESSEINEGDWVTIDRDYAVHHGNRSVENPIIVSKVVRAKDLTTEGNSIYEWGYAPNKALAKTALSAGVAGIKDGTSEGGTYNMDGTTYDGNGIAVGVDSLPPMTAKQITDEKVETFRQKFMQGHKPWEKIGLFKFPEDRYASVDFTLILPKERLELAKKIGIYTRQHSIYDIETDELIELGFSGKNNKNLNGHELAVVRKIIADLSKRPSSPEDIREAQEIVDYIVKNGHSINTMVWRNIHKADKDLRDEKNKQHPKVVEAAIQAKARLISMDEFTEIVREYNPPQAITEPPVTATLTDLVQALDINKVAKKRILGLSGINIRDGEVVSFRLDIPAYNNFDIWVNTIKPAVGAPIYSNISVGNSAIFKHDVKKALKVAEGGAKTPFAVIDVIWENQTVEQTEREIAEALEDSKRKGSTWKQIGFNPQRSGYFYDKATFLPVASADRILQVGPLVMAKNVQYVGKEDTNVSFHGTSTPIEEFYPHQGQVGSSQNLYGSGLYTTMDKGIAYGYTKKGKGNKPTIYKITQTNPGPSLNLETTPAGFAKEFLAEHYEDAWFEGKSLREAIDEFRGDSAYFEEYVNGMPTYEVTQIIDDIFEKAYERGFKSVTHEGGRVSGGKKHKVKIFLNPNKDVKKQRIFQKV